MNRKANGRLEARLRSWRRQKLSFRAISRKIEDEYGVAVTDETVRLWVKSITAADATK